MTKKAELQEIDFRAPSKGTQEVFRGGTAGREDITSAIPTGDEGGKVTIDLRRAAEAEQSRVAELIASVANKGEADAFDAKAWEDGFVELAEINEKLEAALETDRRASNDRRREGNGPVKDMDAKEMQKDFQRAWYKAVQMCFDGEATGVSLCNRRVNEVPEGDAQGNYVALEQGRNGILYLGEKVDAYEFEMPDMERGAISHAELSRFDAADSASTDAGAPLGIIYGDVAEQNMEFLGAFCQPEITDVWYRQDRLDGAGKDLKDIDIPRVNKKLTAGQAQENDNMTEDHTTYDEVVFSANSVDLGRNIPKKYRQKTQLFDFMAQEMIPTHQAITRLREEFIITGDGSRTSNTAEGKPRGYLTALDALTGNDISVVRSTANTQAGFKGKVEDLEAAINKLDVGYRGNPSCSFVMHADVWGWFSSLRSDELRQISPVLNRMDESTRNLMLGLLGNFDMTNKVILHPQYDNVLNAANKIVFSYGPTKAYTFVTTDFIWVFSGDINVKRRGDYFAGYTYDDGDIRWTSVGAPVGLLGKTA